MSAGSSRVCALILRYVLDRRCGIGALSQPVYESLISSQSCDSRKQSRMVTRPVGGRQEDEEHVNGLAVHRAVIRAVLADPQEHLRLADAGTDRMRDGYTMPDAGAEHLLPREQGGQYGLRRRRRALVGDRGQQLFKDAPHVVILHVGNDSFFGQVFREIHGAVIQGWACRAA